MYLGCDENIKAKKIYILMYLDNDRGIWDNYGFTLNKDKAKKWALNGDGAIKRKYNFLYEKLED